MTLIKESNLISRNELESDQEMSPLKSHSKTIIQKRSKDYKDFYLFKSPSPQTRFQKLYD